MSVVIGHRQMVLYMTNLKSRDVETTICNMFVCKHMYIITCTHLYVCVCSYLKEP